MADVLDPHVISRHFTCLLILLETLIYVTFWLIIEFIEPQSRITDFYRYLSKATLSGTWDPMNEKLASPQPWRPHLEPEYVQIPTNTSV